MQAGIAALTSGLAAQALKVVWALAAQRSWRPELFFANGGMPSSHAATVTTLTLLIARDAGTGSTVFALVLVFSAFVVLEATGLRQEIGKQARLLNELRDEIRAGRPPDGQLLRELVGHTWTEVVGGVAVGTVMHFLLRPWVGS